MENQEIWAFHSKFCSLLSISTSILELVNFHHGKNILCSYNFSNNKHLWKSLFNENSRTQFSLACIISYCIISKTISNVLPNFIILNLKLHYQCSHIGRNSANNPITVGEIWPVLATQMCQMRHTEPIVESSLRTTTASMSDPWLNF